MIGTWLFYHFLTTFDYAGRSLILRRRTPETARQARADAERAGAEPLPLWLAREHLLFSRGSIAGLRPAGDGPAHRRTRRNGRGHVRGNGQTVADPHRLRPPGGDFGRAPAGHVYPCYPTEVRLGNAAAKDIYCYANKRSANAPHGFDVLGHFSHSFYKPYNITLDFTDMNVYIARGSE